MDRIPTQIDGCFIIKSKRWPDTRGFFQEMYTRHGHALDPAQQVSWSSSKRGVIRGIHESPYYKLCTCVRGRLWEVAIDLRPESPTYLKKASTWLEADEPTQFLVPAGCGHGFYSAEDHTMLVYLQGGCFSDFQGREYRWNDPAFAIDWPESNSLIISAKDSSAPLYEKPQGEIGRASCRERV